MVAAVIFLHIRVTVRLDTEIQIVILVNKIAMVFLLSFSLCTK